MNWRAFGAVFRREVRRGRRNMLGFTVLALVLIGLALALPQESALGAGAIAVVAGIFSVFAPLGDLRSDKTLGHLEFDRVLPISHRALATARLFGAAARTTPLILFALPLIVALDRGHPLDVGRLAVAIGVPLGAWALLTAAVWALMAINIRWNLRRLWWLPMTIAIAPQLLVSMLPPAAKAAIGDWIERIGAPVLDFLATPAGAMFVIVVVLAVPVTLFWVAISLFASGLERYTFDASAAVPMSAAPPRRELAATGRGPVLAVARYCIRLATEQSRRRLILLAVLVVALLFGSREIKGYAQFYVRALAFLIPGGIALQLSVARTRGHLEGIQQLPHAAMTIGMGYLLGIVALAVPGAAVWVLARAVTGTPVTAGNSLSLTAWMVGSSWLAAVSVMWLTTRRTLMIGAAAVLALVTWATLVGRANLPDRLRAAATMIAGVRTHSSVALPLLLVAAIAAAGLPLFARGLVEYEFAAARPPGWFRRWQEHARARRGWGGAVS